MRTNAIIAAFIIALAPLLLAGECRNPSGLGALGAAAAEAEATLERATR